MLSLCTSVDNTEVTIDHHLINQAGWDRCNLSIYLLLSLSISICQQKNCSNWCMSANVHTYTVPVKMRVGRLSSVKPQDTNS